MRARRAWLLLLLVVPSACALVANLGDRTLGSPDGGRDGSRLLEPEPGPDEVRVDPEAGLPSYCDGITLYASFDRAVTGDRGGKNTIVSGGAAVTPQGKWAAGLALVTDAAAPDEGAAVFYVGDAVWPAREGSLSIWYRGVPGGALAPVLYRPVGSLPPIRS